MRTWSHAAILACLSIKWLTLVVAETIYCDDPELCADNQDGSLLDLEHDSGADDFKDRSTRGDPFLRFGRNEPYLRFGRGDPFLRFGRGDPFLRFGRGDPFLRFGRGDPFLRFGRGDPFLRFGRGDPFLRFGRGDPFLRFGRGDPFLRFGRGDPFLRFGRGDPFLRFGRDNSMARVARGDPFLRFGRFKPSVDTDDSSIDIDDEDITRRSNDDKSNRKKREANASQTDNMAKRMFQGSAAETKDRSSEKRDKYESRETRGNPYMRFGRNNMADYSLSDDTKDTMLDEDFSRISRDPSRIAYPRYGKRSDKGKVYMRFGRTPGSDYMATDSASQKR